MNRRKFLQWLGAVPAALALKIKPTPVDEEMRKRAIAMGRRSGKSRMTRDAVEEFVVDWRDGWRDYDVRAEWPSTIIVTNCSGEVWKSNDFGDTWCEISETGQVFFDDS